MQWHSHSVPSLLLHLPQAVHDLLARENRATVESGLSGLKPEAPSPSHRIISPSEAGDSPTISIEKTLDPMVQRSVQNIGLLLHDYISQLPAFTPGHPASEALLEHWRQLLLEQPQRLGTVKQTSWSDEKTKAFWRERLAHAHKQLSAGQLPDAWDDWHRAAAIGHNVAHPLQLPAMYHKQWQDLVIRTRLHQETLFRKKER